MWYVELIRSHEIRQIKLSEASNLFRILVLNWRYVGHPLAGGAEYWTKLLCEGLVERGFQVTVFTARVDKLPDRSTIGGVEVLRRGTKFSIYWHALLFVKRYSSNFDLIIDEVNTRPFFAELHSKSPVVTMFHQIADEVWNYETQFPLNLLGRYLLERRWLRKYRGSEVVALSESTAESLKEHGILTGEVILPGADFSEVTAREKFPNPTVCFLGRLVPSKRPIDAIDAVREAQKFVPQLSMIIIGSGRLQQKIKRILPPNTTMVGQVSHLEKEYILSRCHVLIATSVREGWGMNVSEASVVGTMTIGYDVPGLRDSVRITGGELVQQSPEQLASALVEFFSSSHPHQPIPFQRKWSDVVDDFEKLIRRRIREAAYT